MNMRARLRTCRLLACVWVAMLAEQIRSIDDTDARFYRAGFWTGAHFKCNQRLNTKRPTYRKMAKSVVHTIKEADKLRK